MVSNRDELPAAKNDLREIRRAGRAHLPMNSVRRTENGPMHADRHIDAISVGDRNQVVALLSCKIEKRARYLGTDDVKSDVFGARVATPVTVKPRQRRGRAGLEATAEHITVGSWNGKTPLRLGNRQSTTIGGGSLDATCGMPSKER